MTKSEQLFERAVKRIPGGVNSPVRSYGAISEAPRFIEKADKCYIYDGADYDSFIRKRELIHIMRQAVNNNFKGFNHFPSP